MIDRRDFLRLGASTALGLAGLEPSARSAAQATGQPHIRRRVRLGRTELRISDISFGSASASDPSLVRHALDRGVNYFDTAESYRWGRSEEAIGLALAGRRDEVFIASKTKAGARETRTDMMRALEGSLRRLRTDYVDVYFNHAVNDVERMQNEEWWAFTEQAQRQGKIRFRGMSGHGTDLVGCLDYAIDHDLVDVILVAYNFAQDPSFYDRLRLTFHFSALQPDLPPMLAKAKAKDVGVLTMKTLMGARLNDMRPYERPGSTYAQAAFRWVLSNPHVDGVVISMNSPREIDEYVSASGDPRLSQADLYLLGLYAQMHAASYCQHGCRRCADSCPEAVPIAEVLRTRMYAVDYGDPTLARMDYRNLAGAAAAPCLRCAHRACLSACPNGVPIAQLTRDAALRLG
jgi:predicted aldo/keto reductase-like oxidoreductase